MKLPSAKRLIARNTRAVINRKKLTSGFVDVLYHADCYPYGMEVNSSGIDYRYGYQGLYAEKDKETGWNNFELRNYDAAVGRWLTGDSKGQYVSPYVGMGNNPVSGVDVDGGWSNWLGAFAYTVIHRGKIHKTAEGLYTVGKVVNGVPNIYAERSIGNGFIQFANANNLSSSKQQYSQSWTEKSYRAFADWGADHPYFHAPSSGEYGPYMPDGVGLSIGVNAYGFSGSLNIAVDEMNNFGFYGSVTSSIGYPSVSPSIGAGVGLDFYENTLPNAGLLGEIAGTTVDTGVGVGNWGLTYSSPVEVKNGLIRKIRGAHKLSVDYSGSYSPYSSGNFSFSYGIGRTKRF